MRGQNEYRKKQEKNPWPPTQKKIIVYSQLIAINILASLASSPQEAIPLIGL